MRWRLCLGLALGIVVFVTHPGSAAILDATWTAPTTNTDGSPLTDLASYRVYYSTGSTPCPGPTFFPVASSTSSPPPNQLVAFRLTGLSAGTTYFAAVTAVDSGGRESPCSPVTSAAARVTFSVSPTSTMNFGSVNLGSIADQTFTVQNTIGGTVSGTASVPAPFSIVSGSPFTVVGLNTTQTVTVRFTPTATATATANVTFTSSGDTVSRVASGSGVDAGLPTVTITTPTTNPTFSTSSPTLTLGGTASDAVGVTQVTWVNDRGGSGTATGTTSWTASGISLQTGVNVLTVTARDAAGNLATASLTVTLTSTFSLTVSKTGAGSGTVTSSPVGISCGATCSAPFASGTAVTLTATPATGSTFSGWSGGGCSGTATCTVTLTAATTVTATFALQAFTLTVSKAGAGAGTVTSSPAGIACGATCSAAFSNGTAVTLTAAPAAGSTFTGWSGGGCSGTGPCTVTISAATSVTAGFV